MSETKLKIFNKMTRILTAVIIFIIFTATGYYLNPDSFFVGFVSTILGLSFSAIYLWESFTE